MKIMMIFLWSKVIDFHFSRVLEAHKNNINASVTNTKILTPHDDKLTNDFLDDENLTITM